MHPLGEARESTPTFLNNISGKLKVTIKQLQVLTGYFNFLTKAIHPGRTFTRRMYAQFTQLQAGKLGGKPLCPHHHVLVDEELHFDCEIWVQPEKLSFRFSLGFICMTN